MRNKVLGLSHLQCFVMQETVPSAARRYMFALSTVCSEKDNIAQILAVHFLMKTHDIIT